MRLMATYVGLRRDGEMRIPTDKNWRRYVAYGMRYKTCYTDRTPLRRWAVALVGTPGRGMYDMTRRRSQPNSPATTHRPSR